MQTPTGEVTDRWVMIHMTGALCTQPAQVVQSEIGVRVIQAFIDKLKARGSEQLEILAQWDTSGDPSAPSPAAERLARALGLLCDLPCDEACVRAPDVADLLQDPMALARFVEELYDHWRSYERYLIFEGRADDSRDHEIQGHRPFIYNNQDLASLTRAAYRRIERNLRGHWPRVYREVPAGANMSLLIDRITWDCPGGVYEQLRDLRTVRLALLLPPVVLNPRRIARAGKFVQVHRNPLERARIDPAQWLSIPLRVGELHFLFCFDREYISLATSLVNLFEVSGHDEARLKPDGIVLFGLPRDAMSGNRTEFYIDEDEGIVIGAVEKSEDVDYFGYCKKMTLTLHNVIMMRRGRLPLHGAMARLRLRGGAESNVVIVGDSAAGKSESLEAFRILAEEHISDMSIIFDDMGSLEIAPDGQVLAYGTEIGAFVRLDDLDPGYAFGHFDRSVFMNPHRTNARVVIPLTEYSEVVRGHPVSLLLYANNYEPVNEELLAIELFPDAGSALRVFRAGMRASKGTTDERGLVSTYFANPFGAEQLRDMHEALAVQYFEAAFAAGVAVGQLRTRLGIEGWEREGPIQAAQALFAWIRQATGDKTASTDGEPA